VSVALEAQVKRLVVVDLVSGRRRREHRPVPYFRDGRVIRDAVWRRLAGPNEVRS
jgi:hypothetical protein